jgi:phytoene dehydrogenase-like protein
MRAIEARPRVGVIGAGPAGMTAAYRLQQLGAEVTVFEAGRHIGGMARSFDLWGHRVDLGPHRFFLKFLSKCRNE